MAGRWIFITLLAVVLVAAGCKHRTKGAQVAAPADLTNPSQEITLVSPVLFADEAVVREAIRDECQLPEKMEQFIVEGAAAQNILVEAGTGSPGSIPGRVLVVEIVDVHGPAGGGYSGAKWTTIEAELFDNGTRSGSLRARRLTTGGAFGGFKGTCSFLGRTVRTLGSDVAGFLQNPSDNAVLGDL